MKRYAKTNFKEFTECSAKLFTIIISPVLVSKKSASSNAGITECNEQKPFLTTVSLMVFLLTLMCYCLLLFQVWYMCM